MPPKPTPTEFDIGLDEFCTRLSSESKSVELIGGFHADETSKGRHTGKAADYRKRFDDYVRRPITG